jgi:hypothetical protein
MNDNNIKHDCLVFKQAHDGNAKLNKGLSLTQRDGRVDRHPAVAEKHVAVSSVGLPGYAQIKHCDTKLNCDIRTNETFNNNAG